MRMMKHRWLPLFMVFMLVTSLFGNLGIVSATTTPTVPFTTTVKVAGGINHVVAVKSDGTVWSWGSNSDGQLGNGSSELKSTTPVQAYGLTRIIDVAAGNNYSLALREDGTVWSWGANASGQLGHGGTEKATLPHRIEELKDIKAISAGYNHNLAIKSDGTVWAWGANNDHYTYSKIGDNNSMSVKTPKQVSPAGKIFKAVSAGYTHSLALDSTGTLWAWGMNTNGQFGDGTTSHKSTPTSTGKGGYKAISAGYNYSLGLKVATTTEPEGTVWSFGSNANNQLGYPTNTTSNPTPSRIAGLAGVTDISAGIMEGPHSLVVKKSDTGSTLWSFGNNASGELGNGTTTMSPTPVEVAGMTNAATAKVAGASSLVVTTDGKVMAWGQNSSGELGNGTAVDQPSPIFTQGFEIGATLTAVANDVTSMNLTWSYPGAVSKYVLKRGNAIIHESATGTTFTDTGVAAGVPGSGLTAGTAYDYTLEVYNDSKLVATKTITESTKDVVSTRGAAPIKMALGIGHTVWLKEDGTVWSWGNNYDGQLGNGSQVDSTTPVQAYGLTKVIAVAAGKNYTLALKDDGTVWSWGKNDAGQLGHSGTEPAYYPHRIEGLTDITAISAGYNHNLAIKKDGTVWAWGANNDHYTYSKIGDNNSLPVKTPKQVTASGTVFKEVSAGYNHSLALDSTGTLWSWGQNSNGQLGLTTYKSTPTNTGKSGFKAISAGQSYSLALKAGEGTEPKNTVWSFGLNKDGQLGNWFNPDRAEPYQVIGLENVAEISANRTGKHSLVVKEDGTVWSFGNNANGQLGDGTTMTRRDPVRVGSTVTNVVTALAIDNHSVAVRDNGTILTWGQLGGGFGTGDYSNAVSVSRLGLSLGIGRGVMLTGIPTSSTSIQLNWGYTGSNPVGKYVLKRGDKEIYSGPHGASPTFVDDGKSDYTFGLTDGTPYLYTLEVYSQDGKLMASKSITVLTEKKAISPPDAAPVRVSAGQNHVLTLRADGTVWAWGSNAKGQLGDGTLTPSTVAVQVSGLTDVKEISAGSEYSLALKKDHTVWAWGVNTSGQLGDSTTTQRSIPVQIMSDVKTISAGYNHNLAIKNDGTIWAWGANNDHYTYSKIGDNNSLPVKTPKQVSPANVVFDAVSAGVSHSLALDSTGTLWSWGTDNNGQLGNGSESYKSVPTKTNKGGFKAISAGNQYSLALTAGTDTEPKGTVWGFGLNKDGQLGNWFSPSLTEPYKVTAFENVTEISAGKFGKHSLAVKQDGTIWAFGGSANGQLGDGTTMTRRDPVRVGSIVHNVVSASPGSDFSVAVKDDGQILTWGKGTLTGTAERHNVEGGVLISPVHLAAAATNPTTVNLSYYVDGVASLVTWKIKRDATSLSQCSMSGNNLTCEDTGLVPGSTYLYRVDAYNQEGAWLGSATAQVIMQEVEGVIAVMAGANHSLALKGDGSVWAWGRNSSGQLGTNSTNMERTAHRVDIPADQKIVAVSAKQFHSFALDTDGDVWAWGHNAHGQLGNGTPSGFTDVNNDGKPDNVIKPVQLTTISNVKMVSTGATHSLALKEDGTVWAWGDNQFGQLGGRSELRVVYPVQVTGLSNIKSVVAGIRSSYAISNDGSVWAWGDNRYGQLGSACPMGTTCVTSTPVQIGGLGNIKEVITGFEHVLALDGDGALWSWGHNNRGQLGTRMEAVDSKPQKITDRNFNNANAISAGGYHFSSLALRSAGQLWGVGDNRYGQLGNKRMSNSEGLGVMMEVQDDPATPEVEKVVAYSGGAAHSIVLLSNGKVMTTGDNRDGALGNGLNESSTSLVEVVFAAEVQAN